MVSILTNHKCCLLSTVSYVTEKAINFLRQNTCHFWLKIDWQNGSESFPSNIIDFIIIFQWFCHFSNKTHDTQHKHCKIRYWIHKKTHINSIIAPILHIFFFGHITLLNELFNLARANSFYCKSIANYASFQISKGRQRFDGIFEESRDQYWSLLPAKPFVSFEWRKWVINVTNEAKFRRSTK